MPSSFWTSSLSTITSTQEVGGDDPQIKVFCLRDSELQIMEDVGRPASALASGCHDPAGLLGGAFSWDLF